MSRQRRHPGPASGGELRGWRQEEREGWRAEREGSVYGRAAHLRRAPRSAQVARGNMRRTAQQRASLPAILGRARRVWSRPLRQLQSQHSARLGQWAPAPLSRFGATNTAADSGRGDLLGCVKRPRAAFGSAECADWPRDGAVAAGDDRPPAQSVLFRVSLCQTAAQFNHQRDLGRALLKCGSRVGVASIPQSDALGPRGNDGLRLEREWLG